MTDLTRPSGFRIQEAMTALSKSLEAMLIRDQDALGEPDMLGDLLEADPASGDGMDVLRRVVRYAMQQEDYAEAISVRILLLKTRLERFQRNAGDARRIVADAMQSLGLRQLPNFPDATVTMREGAQRAQVYDEGAVPAQYVEVRTVTTIDKRKLLADLKDKQAVPGATLTNGPGILTIRRG